MRIDRLPVAEGLVGFLLVMLVVTFVLARHEVGNPTSGNAEGSPTPAGSATAAPSGGAMVIDMQDFKFVYNGQDNPTINVAANTDVSFDVTNTGTAIHNIHVDGPDGNYDENFCKPNDGVATACTDPDKLPGGTNGTLTFNLAPGTYKFRCDYHPTQMTGEFVVQ